MVLEVGCFYNQNEVMLNVTLEHHSTGFMEGIALCPASNPPEPSIWFLGVNCGFISATFCVSNTKMCRRLSKVRKTCEGKQGNSKF